MFPYVLLMFLPIAMSRIRFGRATPYAIEHTSNTAMKIFWGLLFLLLALRHETVGIDLKVYKRIYNIIDESSWGRALGRSPEIGWSFLNKLVAVLGGNFRWVIIIAAWMETYALSKAYLKYSEDSALTVVLFMNMMNFVILFSGLRQSIAIAMGLWAFEYVRQKKVMPFLGVVAMAIMFHTSAFMLLLMYPLYHVKIKKKWLLFIVPLLLIVYVFKQQVFSFLGLILSLFTDYDVTIQQTDAFAMLVLFILMAVFAFVVPDEQELDADTIGMRNFLLLSVALQMFASLHNTAMRMNYYYIAFIPLLIPRIIERRSERWKQVAVLARGFMLLFFIVFFFATAPADNLLDTFPYRFLWE